MQLPFSSGPMPAAALLLLLRAAPRSMGVVWGVVRQRIHTLLPARTRMCFVISVTRDSLSSAASSMPPIWLYTNRLDSSTAREKICVLY